MGASKQLVEPIGSLPFPNDQNESQHENSSSQNSRGDSEATPAKAADLEKSLEPTETETVQEQSARDIHGFKWFLICVSLYTGAFLYGLDTTIAADIQAPIVEDFKSVEKLSWIGTGYPLGSVAVILAFGAAYNNFNMKWLYIGAFSLFEVGSLLCGVATSMNMLIVGRVVCGLGGSGIYMGALNILTVRTNKIERGPYIAAFGFIWGIGSILGPLVGGAFSSSSATWRWAFYINLVFAAICAPVYLFYLPPIHPRPGKTVEAKLRSIDWTGILLSAAIVVDFTLCLTFGGAAWAWGDKRLTAAFIVLGVLLVLFVAQQKFCIFTSPTKRVYPAHLLHSRTQILLYIGTSCAVTNLFVPTYYIPIYFQFVSNDSPIKAAVRLLPFITVLVSATMVAGFVLPRMGIYMPLYVISGILATTGGVLMYTVTSHTPAGHIYGFSILVAIGSGITNQAGYAIGTVKVAREGRESDTQNVVSFQNVAQVGSTLISLVVSGQVFQSVAFNGLQTVLAGQNFSDSQIRDAVSGTKSLVFETIDAGLRQQAIDAITAAMSKVYILSFTAGALTICIAPFMKRERIFGD